ncbi:MAG: hypothetical protein GY842_15975 [bacterium]|nr:hypothetical protein [bacterium]
MMIRWILCASMLSSLIGGCATASPQKHVSYARRERLQQSLFPGDTSALGNDAIEKVLSGRVVLQDHARIGVVSLGTQQYAQRYSARLVSMHRQAAISFVAQLSKAHRVDDVWLIPSLLVPEKPTVPKLREMAARCQADMIFVHTVGHEIYRRSKFLAADEMRGYCQVEGVLLDTRTGIVAMTASSVLDFVAKESREDMDFSETIRRSEIEATSLALEEIAAELVSFLNAAGQ